MLPPLQALVVVLATSPLAAAAPSLADDSVIAISESGIMLLDQSGALLAWRPEVFQWWQRWHIATNPRNGTVCWVSSPEDQNVAGVMRCAPVDNLNQTWDLPQPRAFSVSKPDAIIFDWAEENWYLTVSRIKYVCSYMFDRCAKLGESGGNVRYFAAYDFLNRLLFRIATVRFGPYKLEVLNLDGSGVRELPTHLIYPAGLAVDPVRRQIFVIDQAAEGFDIGIYKLDYNGEGKELLTPLDRVGFHISWERSLDVLDGTGVVMYNNRRTISAFSAEDGQKSKLVDGAVKGETVPALAKVEKLLAVKIFSQRSQPELENPCASVTCSALCIPKVVDAVAEASCLCPQGERLVDLGCQKEYPLHAVVTGGDKIQAVDMHNEEVTTILSGLTDVSKVDFFWTGGEEFLLFWVDANSLFRGHWFPNGTITDVQILLEASEKRKVLEVAVDWVHRHIVWMERDPTKSKYSKQITFILSPFDGSYQKNISIYYGNRKQAMFVFRAGQYFGYAKESWGDFEIVTRDMTGSTSWGAIGAIGSDFLTSLPDDIAVDRSLAGITWQERFFWIGSGEQAIYYITKSSILSKAVRTRLLTHPSLADAGGLDVLDSRLFWTERPSGRLWTANGETGGEVRALPVTTAGGALRLLHPWRQPPRPEDQAPCKAARGGCSHFCLSQVATWEWEPRCLCPDGMQLGGDRKTCQS